MQNLLARRAKGAIVFIATARDVRRPEADPVLVGSVEASTHEFDEVGFSPCLSEARAREEEEGNEDEDGEVGDDGYCFYSRVSNSSSGRASSSLPSSSSSKTKKGSKLYITGMMVSEAFRRQGVAASLLRVIDTHASQNQIDYICLYVEGSNESALKLYERNGYHLVVFSPQAESFASAIGLYKGPFSARQYSFAYKRLMVGVTGAGAVAAAGGEKEEGKKEKENLAWPGRVLDQQQQQQQRQNPLTLTAPTWWFTSKGGEEGGEGKEQQQQQQQEKSLLSEPSKPFPARSPSLMSPF